MMNSKADILIGAGLVKKCERGECNSISKAVDNLH